jgi:hypothetical protein
MILKVDLFPTRNDPENVKVGESCGDRMQIRMQSAETSTVEQLISGNG